MTPTAIRKRFSDEYRNAVASIPNRDAEMIYVKLAKKGDRAARTTLIYKYIPFLYKMASQLKDSAYNLTIDEMVNAAVFGFNKAIASFDPTMGVAFYTYYAPKALNEMKKAAYESLLVHRPENQLKSKKPNKISVSMVDIDFKPERGNSISSMLTTDDCTDELTVDNERQKLATEFMGMLVNNERDVMNSLFMCSCEAPTLRQVGMEMNVSHERVRQLKEAAIKRIRSSERYADMVAESKYLAKEAV